MDRRSFLSPSQPHQGGSSQPQSVLLAEVLEHETVVQFYEDYAKLAFGDPMGRALRRGKLLKYRTKDDIIHASEDRENRNPQYYGHRDANGGVCDDSAFNKLGEKDGVIDCMYCWNVRRDNFEVPQLIVLNVSAETSVL